MGLYSRVSKCRNLIRYAIVWADTIIDNDTKMLPNCFFKILIVNYLVNCWHIHHPTTDDHPLDHITVAYNHSMTLMPLHIAIEILKIWMIFYETQYVKKVSNFVTICVNAATASRNVSGQCKVWNPQIFDINITECLDNRLVETFSSKHWCDGVCQVE